MCPSEFVKQEIRVPYSWKDRVCSSGSWYVRSVQSYGSGDRTEDTIARESHMKISWDRRPGKNHRYQGFTENPGLCCTNHGPDWGSQRRFQGSSYASS